MNEQIVMKIKVFVHKTHSAKCVYGNKERPDYFPSGEVYFGGRTGRTDLVSGHSHYWLPVGCNDPDCKFQGAVKWLPINDLLTENPTP